jgi:hypothetical protein
VWSGDARVLGELIEVSVRGSEVRPGVLAVVDLRLKDDLDTGGPQLGGCTVDVVDEKPGDGTGGGKWRLIGLSGPKTPPCCRRGA